MQGGRQLAVPLEPIGYDSELLRILAAYPSLKASSRVRGPGFTKTRGTYGTACGQCSRLWRSSLPRRPALSSGYIPIIFTCWLYFTTDSEDREV